MLYIEWYKFYSNNLLVILGSKQGGDVETHEHQTCGLSANSIADFISLNFLAYFAKMSSYLSIKTNKRKLRKYRKCVKEFSRRVDLANGKYLSILL